MPTRTPHLGHLFLLLGLTLLALLGCEIVGLALFARHDLLAGAQDMRLQISINAITYVVALSLCFPVFPLIWKRGFLEGIQWNWAGVKPWLAAIGLAVGVVAQAVTTLLPKAKEMPIEQLFRNHAVIWVLVVFGTILAPLFEEILFRGFMLPGIAMAVDFLRLPRSVDAYESWSQSANYSRAALITSSIITSLAFAGIHAPQLGFTWPAVSLLAVVSLFLCWIRIWRKSVAASTIVHGFYNFSVFLTAFIVSHGFRDLSKF